MRQAFLSCFAAATGALCASPPGQLGPAYPAPSNLSSQNSTFLQAWKNFSSTLDSYVASKQAIEGLVPDLGNYTFSIGAYSLHDASAASILQYHHTGPDVSNASTGVRSVDENSIYRIGSVSKVFTVYTTLLAVGTKYWDRPVSDFVSELLLNETTKSFSDAFKVDWQNVTLGALAGQMGGILRDVSPLNGDVLEILQAPGSASPESLGLPPLDLQDTLVDPPCVQYYARTGNEYCPEDNYLQSIIPRYPVYAPWTAPSYSNTGFNLLGLAVQNITGTPFNELMQNSVFDPLNLSSTFYEPPTELSHAVIPGGQANASFSQDYGVTIPGGGILSSLSDLAKFGRSIMNSSLLDRYATAEWLKPVSHGSSFYLSVGRPWEIFRFQEPLSGRVSDLYSKSGDVENFSSWIVLSPDHGTGFTVLAAGLDSSLTSVVGVLLDMLLTNVIPALDAQAAAEAALNYAGQYSSQSQGLNSSLTISVNQTRGPGLHVDSLISNGTDLLYNVFATMLGFDSLSLLPTGLVTDLPDGSQQIPFRASKAISSLDTSQLGPALNPANAQWFTLDSPMYGGIAFDLFIATRNKTGQIVAMSPAALRTTMEKVA